MTGDLAESVRRDQLANEHIQQYPPKVTFNKKNIAAQVKLAFLMGYNKCAEDLLSPKDTPGVPATAITLLNRVGEMLLMNRAAMLKIPTPRPQCPGCFCLMERVEDQRAGWCDKCVVHKAELINQCARLLQPNAEDITIPPA